MWGNNRKETFTDRALNVYRFYLSFCLQPFSFTFLCRLFLIFFCNFSLSFFWLISFLSPVSFSFYRCPAQSLCFVIPITLFCSLFVVVSLD